MMCRQLSHVMTFVGWCLLSLAVLQLDTCAAHKPPDRGYISEMKHLHDYLMEDYKTSIRPVNDSTETVTVNLHMRILLLDDLDEKNQALRLSGYLYQRWKDAGLVWNAIDFNNITSIEIPISEIWRPDIAVLNSKNAYYVPPTHHLASTTSTGIVWWVPPFNTETHCDLDLSEFPFDEHVCKVIFISWTQSELGVNLTSQVLGGSTNKGLKVELESENREWKLKRVTIERQDLRYTCCPEAYPQIVYNLTIQRRSTFATHLFIGPSVILCMVTPAVFLLPPGSGEKMMFGIGVLIADTLLLGELIDYIPTAHPNIPLIGKYFLANIIMASLSLAISAIIVGFWDKSTSRMSGPPAFFRLIVLDPMATLLCVKKNDLVPSDETSIVGAMEMNPEGENTTDSASGVDPATEKRRHFMANYLRNAAMSEWRQLAIVFDRLFFVIYCVILAILTLCFARYM